MLKWFYKWLGRRIQDSQYTEDHPVPILGASNKVQRVRKSVRESEEFLAEPIQFKMYKASGGWAIEFRQYDSKNDRLDTTLYVVTDEEELGKSVSQIITMEALKR